MDPKNVPYNSEVAKVYASFPLGDGVNIRVLDILPPLGTTKIRARLRVVSLEANCAPLKTMEETGSPVEPVQAGANSTENVREAVTPEREGVMKHKNSNSRYEALSYTWGASTEGHTILLNGGVPINVTDNLYQALRRLRYVSKVRTLWVDALCINQADTVERADQVGQMGLIYKAATCVNVWLGESGWVFPISARMLRWTWRYRAELMWPAIWPRRRAIEHMSWQLVRFHLEAMAKAIRNSSPRWHERVWVAQEYILAEKVRFCFGRRKLTDYQALKALRHGFLLEDDDICSFARRIQDTWDPFKESHTIETARDNFAEGAIGAVADSAASDPRDRVYGVLGFIKKEERALVPVDYSLLPWEVFATATAASIAAQQNHKILAYVDLSGRVTANLPSWAVNFETVAKMLSENGVDSHLGFARVRRKARSENHAAYSNPSRRSLNVLAHLCGTVANIICLHETIPIPILGATVSDEELRQVPAIPDQTERREAFVVEAAQAFTASTDSTDLADAHVANPDILFLRKLSEDPKLVNIQAMRSRLRADGHERIEKLRRSKASPFLQSVVNNWIDSVLCAPNNLNISSRDTAYLLHHVSQYACYALAASGGCCLFSTTAGLVGLAPWSIAPGDVLLLGAAQDFPFLLLRPTEGHYRFRGLALMHDLDLYPPFPGNRTDGSLHDLALWAGITKEREIFEIR